MFLNIGFNITCNRVPIENERKWCYSLFPLANSRWQCFKNLSSTISWNLIQTRTEVANRLLQGAILNVDVFLLPFVYVLFSIVVTITAVT